MPAQDRLKPVLVRAVCGADLSLLAPWEHAILNRPLLRGLQRAYEGQVQRGKVPRVRAPVDTGNVLQAHTGACYAKDPLPLVLLIWRVCAGHRPIGSRSVAEMWQELRSTLKVAVVRTSDETCVPDSPACGNAGR